MWIINNIIIVIFNILVTKNASPWDERSKEVKKEYSLNVEIKKKLEKLNAEKIKLVENSIMNVSN